LFVDDALCEIFAPVAGASDDVSGNVMLYVCCRHDHVPVLHIRDARYRSEIMWYNMIRDFFTCAEKPISCHLNLPHGNNKPVAQWAVMLSWQQNYISIFYINPVNYVRLT